MISSELFLPLSASQEIVIDVKDLVLGESIADYTCWVIYRHNSGNISKFYTVMLDIDDIGKYTVLKPAESELLGSKDLLNLMTKNINSFDLIFKQKRAELVKEVVMLEVRDIPLTPALWDLRGFWG